MNGYSWLCLRYQARDKDSQDRSMSMILNVKRAADVRNGKVGHNVDRPITPPTYEEGPSTFAYPRAGNLRKPYRSVPVRNGNEESATRGEPRCLFGGYTRKREALGDQDPENVMIDESLILNIEYEIDQLASALALISKVVSEKVQDANELDQFAKPEVLEREMIELTSIEAKVAELKSLMAKISAQFNAPNIEDDAFNREILQGAAFVLDLERKLAAQEKIAKETSLIIQQLSTSPHLSSPYNNPPAQAWRTVQETPQRASSHNVHQAHIAIDSANENSRNALPEENSSQFWERQGFPSALRNFNQNRNKNTQRQTVSPMKQLERPYQFQIGALNSVPASASRSHPRTGSRNQPNSVENQPSHRISFRPDPETSSGFSFGHYNAEVAEQGDRMSSPEPEPHSHRFPHFNPSPEPSATPALAKWIRPNYSGSEFSLSPGFNSLVNTPAHDESRYSPLAQFRSPWFGLIKDEPSSKLSRPLFTSPPPSNSGLDDTTPEVRKVKVSFSERDQGTSEDRAKIKRLIGERKLHSGSNSAIGVSPFAARMAQLKVGPSGTFDKGQVSQEDEEDVGWGLVGTSAEERRLFNKDVEALCQSIADLDAQDGGQAMRESRDSSGSWNPDEPVVLLPSLLRRSNESSNQRH